MRKTSRRESTTFHLTVLALACMLVLLARCGRDAEVTVDAETGRAAALAAGELPVTATGRAQAVAPVGPVGAPTAVNVAPMAAAAEPIAADMVPVAGEATPASHAPSGGDESARPANPTREAAIGEADAPDRLNPAGERVVLEGKYELPVVSDGRRSPPSPLQQAPGYEPPDDPESDAVARGYRLAPPNPSRLAAGSPSAEELARDILGAIGANDRQGLFDLRISFEEFEDILWPEMPQSRPITHISAQDAWFFLQRESVSAVDGTLGERGGQALDFTRLTFDVGLTRYPNYRLYRGVVIHANQADGQEVVLKFAHTLVEKDGTWKVCMYKG